MNKLYQDREWLREKYVIDDSSGPKIAKIYNYAPRTIGNWLSKFNLKKIENYKNKEWLFKKYWQEKESIIDIGKSCKRDPSTITRWLQKFNIKKRWPDNKKRDGKSRSGTNNPNWKGGKFMNNGYVYIHVAGQRYRGEHTLKAEKALGRKLKKGELVHHIDGDKSNNKNSNLLICDRSYHTWLEKRMAYLYQKEHFQK